MKVVRSEVTLSLVVRARASLCALPIGQLVETMRPLPTRPFPSAPTFVLGVARIRGGPVPVVDLGALLGFTGPARPARFVTLRLDGRSVALAVEDVVAVRELDSELQSELPPLLAGVDEQAVVAIGRLDAELLLVVRAARLLPDRVWEMLDAGGAA